MVKIIVGEKLLDIANAVIKSIGDKKFDLSQENIIVVPDRFSLLAEKMVFSSLNIKSTFNIKVMGVTSLAKKIISEANLDCVFCDAQESKFILYRAIQKSKDSFLCFSKNLSQGLCQKIQNALSLIRSSDVKPDELLNIQYVDVSTQNKLHDLSIVYKNYEEMLNFKLDGNNTLKLFTSIIQTTVNLKNKNFYFCGFDAFTKQGYQIIDNISKTAGNLTIGAFLPPKTKNASIYDKEMFNNLTEIFKQNNIDYKVEYSHSVLSLVQKEIFDNVYGYMLSKGQNYGYANVLQMSSKKEEIEFVAQKILELTKLKKCKYKDIFVATNQSYFSQIENVFNKCNISFYVDKSANMYETQVSNFVRYVFDCAIVLEKENILNLLNNIFVNIKNNSKNDIENYIYENNIEFGKVKELTEYFNIEELNKVFDFIKNIQTNGTIEYYVNTINNLLTIFDVENKINLLCERFLNDNDLINQKTYAQIFDKLTELNSKLQNSIGAEEISLLDFYELYFNAIQDIKISQVPLTLDGVYVGDVSSSFFEKSKYAFFVGANQDVLPTQIKDLGLIGDEEIENLTKVINISPTVKMINKRNKFKLFDVLTNASDNIFITYSLSDSDGKKMLPSQFVLDILKINDNKNLFLNEEIYEHFVDDTITKTMFKNPTINIAQNNLSPYNSDYLTIKNALLKFGLNVNINDKNEDSILDGQSMFKNDFTKISQIESYYSCPFLHFCRYGLKLQEQKMSEIEPNEFGNFLHQFAELFVNTTKPKLGSLTEEEILLNTKTCYNSLLKNKNYKKLSFKENDTIKEVLFNEVLRFANFVNYEQSSSDFKVFKTEFAFGKNKEICLNIKNKNYYIVGVVDRIDKMDNYFRIIDYKTGSLQSSNAKISNLYYGTKVQVYVYLNSIKDTLNLKPFGAFYLPIVNAYKKESEDEYKLLGYFLDDINLVLRADKNLSFDNPKSKFMEAGLSTAKENLKNNKKVLNSKKKVSDADLTNMLTYAVKIVENAIQEILDGNISPSPFDNACQFCKYKNICKMETKMINVRKAEGKITVDSFNIKEEEDGTK